MRLPSLLYVDDVVLCVKSEEALVLRGELEKDLRVMVGQFVKVCKICHLKQCR